MSNGKTSSKYGANIQPNTYINILYITLHSPHTHLGNIALPVWLTHACDLLCDQVLQQGVQHKTVSGVQLMAIDPNVET